MSMFMIYLFFRVGTAGVVLSRVYSSTCRLDENPGTSQDVAFSNAGVFSRSETAI